MGFNRQVLPTSILTGPELDSAMVSLGMLFTAAEVPDANIEDTILAASISGMLCNDLRVLSVLVTWLGVHHERLNADRLVRIVDAQQEPRVRAFWTSIGRWLRSDRRFARLAQSRRKRVDLLSVGNEFQIKRRGEDPRFKDSPLRVPAGVLRDRKEDVLSPRTLSKSHSTYRQRIIMGPTYRADMWALLESEPELSAAEVARRTYGSFASAWQVKRDFDLVGRNNENAADIRRAS